MIKASKIYFISETLNVFEQAYYNAIGNVNICGLISDTIKQTQFGIPIYSSQWMLEQDLSDTLIIIADNSEMLNIIKRLMRYDLQLIRDWIPYWMYFSCEISPEKILQLVGGNKERFHQAMLEIKKKKQMVLIHGNCQTQALRYYLKQNEEFAEKYVLVEMPQLWNVEHKEKYDKMFDVNIFSYVDILITQIIAKENRFGERVSTEYVSSLVSSSCKIITICNLFFDGYYPQNKNHNNVNNFQLDSIVNKSGLNVYNGCLDYIVAEKVIEGKTLTEILEYISSEEVFDRKWLYDFIFDGLNYSKRKELECDIKLCNYIEENLNKEILFTTNAHPCEILMVELSKRILQELDNKDVSVYCDGNMFALGIPSLERFPIYPAIFKCLNLDKSYNELMYKLPNGKKVNFREYMTVYIKTVFPSVV